ncbi:MAG: hypothetical protein JSU01_19930 [Bacteroidetes bacterium]|nr:hypothetical protein [Bacteroidota bacterium]
MERKPEKTQKVTRTFTKLALPLLACAVMLYTSCRKTENAPAPVNKAGQTTTPTNAALAKQIAMNLAHSVSGRFGGINLMGGMNSLSLGQHNAGLENPLLCGLFTDSLVDLNSTQGDTTTHIGGNQTFFFNCDSGKTKGYVAYDSLNTTRKVPNGWYQGFYVKQAYTIKCLDSRNRFIGVNGDNYFYQYMNLICDCGKNVVDIENCNFVLNNLKICLDCSDIVSGTATFTAYGEGWHVSGTLEFIGNHTANVTIGGDTFQINTLDYSW